MRDRMTYAAHMRSILVLGLPLAGSNVAQIAIQTDGNTVFGATPEIFTQRLDDWGADVIGLNCSVGPAMFLDHLPDPGGVAAGPFAVAAKSVRGGFDRFWYRPAASGIALAGISHSSFEAVQILRQAEVTIVSPVRS